MLPDWLKHDLRTHRWETVVLLVMVVAALSFGRVVWYGLATLFIVSAAFMGVSALRDRFR